MKGWQGDGCRGQGGVQPRRRRSVALRERKEGVVRENSLRIRLIRPSEKEEEMRSAVRPPRKKSRLNRVESTKLPSPFEA